ncbi:MAG: glycosyl transferase family 1, partial [Flavobacterium sp.]|nr:glycosyl transferase family 1 [Flavobacterium sp.]
FPIVTDIPSNRAWIKDNKNGFLCPTDDPNQLSKKILEVLINNNLRVKTAKRNQALVEERGSYKKNMEMMEKYYLQLISSKN